MLATTIAGLEAVDWTKGEHWVGIAGAQEPKGVNERRHEGAAQAVAPLMRVLTKR
jgi:hypothetical protein